MPISTTTLKNAALAIEHDLFTDPDGANYLVKDGAILRRWEPETSSADSFELAVKLRLSMELYCGEAVIYFDDTTGGDGRLVQDDGDEGVLSDVELTRIAIVRAAAIIGESLKCQS